jgi:hypothetical protein
MRAAIVSAVILAALVGPVAFANDGDIMRVGAGNSAQTAETRIIGQNVSTFATRQSNNKEGDGGAATYGCRSSIGNEPCLAVFALRTARAFDFRSRGNEGGVITVSGDPNPRNNRPFTTNATGVASGLNADEVDGKSADDLRARWVIFNQQGAIGNQFGVASVTRIDQGAYVVAFNQPIDNCGFTATNASANVVAIASAERSSDSALLVKARNITDGEEVDAPMSVAVTC